MLCISKKFPSDAAAATLGTTLWEAKPKTDYVSVIILQHTPWWTSENGGLAPCSFLSLEKSAGSTRTQSFLYCAMLSLGYSRAFLKKLSLATDRVSSSSVWRTIHLLLRILSHEGQLPQWFVGWQKGQKWKIKHPLLTTYSLTYSARTGLGHLHFPEIQLQCIYSVESWFFHAVPKWFQSLASNHVTLICSFCPGMVLWNWPGGWWNPWVEDVEPKSDQGH